MTVPSSGSAILRKRPGGQIIDALDWAINNGPSKWCDDITYNADATITQLYITADTLTVDEGYTLTATQLRPVIIVANTINIDGTIDASGKGCDEGPTGSGFQGYRYAGVEWPFEALASEEASQTRNYCLCGAGGGAGIAGTADGGGAYGAGGDAGAPGSAGSACDLTDAQIKQILFSPYFNIFQIGFGGGGGSYAVLGGSGGGSIL